MTTPQNEIKAKVTLDDGATFIGDYLRWAARARARCTLVPRCCYRGHADASWRLVPSMVRGHERLPVTVVKQFEREVIQACRDQFQLKEDWTDVEVLAFARHHGAPTRLLDWSSNPLVALWFAVATPEHDESDGVVFSLNVMPDQPGHLIWSIGKKCLDDCDCQVPVHLFRSTKKLERSDAQQSFFTIAAFSEDRVLRPLEEILPNKGFINNYPVPRAHKAELRYLLSIANFDPFSVYRNPDSFGASLSAVWDIQGWNVDYTMPTGA